MNKFKQYHPLVIEWARQKEILGKSKPSKQLTKTLEEIQELLVAIEDKNIENCKDAIGDIVVTLIIYCELKGIDLEKYYERELSVFKPDDIDAIIYDIIHFFNHLYHSEKNFKELSSKTHLIYDLFACLTVLSNYFDLHIWDCLESAYDEIKDRKGKMVNGIFIREK